MPRLFLTAADCPARNPYPVSTGPAASVAAMFASAEPNNATVDNATAAGAVLLLVPTLLAVAAIARVTLIVYYDEKGRPIPSAARSGVSA